MSATGSPVLVLEICRGSIQDVSIVGPNRGSVPNEQLARFHADRAAAAGTVLVDALHPTGGWTQQPGSILSAADPAELKIASGSGPKNALRQVDFTDPDLMTLDTETVLYTGFDGRNTVRQRMPLADFRAYACR